MNQTLSKKKSNKIILGHPFSGALYAYFDSQLNNGSHTVASKYHSYYKTLYGKHFYTNLDITLTLALIYDDIIICPADNPVPQPKDKKLDYSHYYNEELGLYFSWDEFSEKRNEFEIEIRTIINDVEILKILNGIPKHAHQQILNDLLYEIYLANNYKATLFTSGMRQSLANRIIQISNQKFPNYAPPIQIEIISNYLEITGILFNPMGLDNFIYLKQEKDLKIYSKSFLNLVENFRPKDSNIKKQMLSLAKDALETKSINSKLSGIFSSSSSILSIAGLIPALGTITGIAGIGIDISDRINQHIAKKGKWYEFGPQILKTKSLYELNKKLENI